MTTKLPFKEAVDTVAAELQCDQKDIADRWGKSPQHLSQLISGERKGIPVKPKVFKSFTNEFQAELTGLRTARVDTDKIVSELAEKVIRAEAYIKVLVEELVHMKAKQQGIDKKQITVFSKEELEYLAKRAKVEAARLLSEYKG